MVSKRWTPRNHAMGGLFVFLLLALFALTCLVTVLLSVQGYLGIQADVDQCASQRVLAGYLRGKVRSSDLAGGVALRQEEGRTVLCLRQGDWKPGCMPPAAPCGSSCARWTNPLTPSWANALRRLRTCAARCRAIACAWR